MELNKNLAEQKSKNEQNIIDFIDYKTQIKILKGTLAEKCENIDMCDNEKESWKIELHKEKIEHYNSLQNISALEYKLKKIHDKNNEEKNKKAK